MKTLTLFGVATFVLVSSTAQAGGLAPIADPEPTTIVADVAPPSSASNLVVPLLLLALVALASSSGGSDDAGAAATPTDFTPG